jgi:hypothetical protein
MYIVTPKEEISKYSHKNKLAITILILYILYPENNHLVVEIWSRVILW